MTQIEYIADDDSNPWFSFPKNFPADRLRDFLNLLKNGHFVDFDDEANESRANSPKPEEPESQLESKVPEQKGHPESEPVPNFPAGKPNTIDIPPALKPLTEYKRWLIWRWKQKKNGEWTKIPYQGHALNRKASTTNPETWCYLKSAMSAYTEGRCDGVGYVLTNSDISAIDIDHCRNATTGELHLWATEQIALSNSYAEVTPSNEGVRIIGLSNGGNPLNNPYAVPDTNLSGELYRRPPGRYITITGKQIGAATELKNIDAQIDNLVPLLVTKSEAFPSPKETTNFSNPPAADAGDTPDHLEVASKFRHLLVEDLGEGIPDRPAPKTKLTAQELLNANGIYLKNYNPGNHSRTCPKCLADRKRENKKKRCLSVKIDDRGATWNCHNCGWSGPEKGQQRTDGRPTQVSDEIAQQKPTPPAPTKPTPSYDDKNFVAIYDYPGFQKVRFPKGHEPRFLIRHRDPSSNRAGKGWDWGAGGADTSVLYRKEEIDEAIANGYEIVCVEGEKDVNNLWAIGIPATCSVHGAAPPDQEPKWTIKHSEQLRDADIVVLGDHDAPGYAHQDATCKLSLGIAKRVRILKLADHWPEIKEGGDVSDYFAAGHTREQLDELIAKAADYAPEKPRPPISIDEAITVFKKWLILRDYTPIYALLGTIAANLLPGDPVWLGLVAPPSSAKTELLISVARLLNMVPTATITLAALLSGTPKKQQAAGAKGGLLRQIGDFGFLLLKDFGSVLSMRPDAKAEVLGALREIFDGEWTRHLGTEGGKTLSWKGKLGLLFGVTGVIDSHYAVIGAMGDRSLLCRLKPGEGQLKRALAHVGTKTQQMRKELAEAVVQLFAKPRNEPQSLTDDEFKELDEVVSLVVRLRGAVDRDRVSREVEAIYGAEGTGRIGLCLERLLAGLDTLGVNRTIAMGVVRSVAMDSVPPLRRAAYELLLAHKATPKNPQADQHKNLEPLATLLEAWKAAIGVNQKRSLAHVIEMAHPRINPDLNAAFLAVAPAPTMDDDGNTISNGDDENTISNVLLARWLRDHNEVPTNGLMLSGGGVDEKGSPWWTLLPAAPHEQPKPTTLELETPEIAATLGLPTNTVRRALEDLAAYELVQRIKGSKADRWKVP